MNTSNRPLSFAVLGGYQLFKEDAYIISLVTPEEAKELAASLAKVDKAWLSKRYDAIDANDYGCPKSSEDFD